MRILKLLGLLAAGALGLLLLAALSVRLLVNPNDYKGRIVRLAWQATGRELALPGEIHLSVFPWIALELGPASLGNPAGFPAQPFVSLRHASLQVKLLPLMLRRELEIGHVQVEGLDLRLIRSAQGKGNWQGLGGSAGDTGRGESSRPTALSELAGLTLKDSRISYQTFLADHVNLDVGALRPGKIVPVKLRLTLSTGPASSPIEVAGNLGVLLEDGGQQLTTTDVSLEGSLARASSGARTPWKITAPQARLDQRTQTLSVPRFSAELGPGRLTGDARGTHLAEAPQFEGSFNLEPLSPRELLKQLGVSSPDTRDPHVLSRLSGRGTFGYGPDALRLAGLEVHLDDSTLRGALGMTSLGTPAITFDLALDQIDVDRYRSPKRQSRPAETRDSGPGRLGKLELKGRATVGQIRVAGLAASQVRLEIGAAGGLIRVQPARAKFYGGECSADITLDERSRPAGVRIDSTLNSVDVAPLLKDLAGSQRLSGHGNVQASLTARGDAGDSILRTLDGHVTANLANGAVEGLDLWFEISRALALLNQGPMPEGSSSGRTRFDTFRVSADLKNGIAATRDLNIASQNLHVTGQGNANLATEAIDYHLDATLFRGAPGVKATSRDTLAEIPVAVTGTMTSPRVRPDVAGLAKARVQQELQKHAPQLQQTLQDVLKNVLH